MFGMVRAALDMQHQAVVQLLGGTGNAAQGFAYMLRGGVRELQADDLRFPGLDAGRERCAWDIPQVVRDFGDTAASLLRHVGLVLEYTQNGHPGDLGFFGHAVNCHSLIKHCNFIT